MKVTIQYTKDLVNEIEESDATNRIWVFLDPCTSNDIGHVHNFLETLCLKKGFPAHICVCATETREQICSLAEGMRMVRSHEEESVAKEISVETYNFIKRCRE